MTYIRKMTRSLLHVMPTTIALLILSGSLSLAGSKPHVQIGTDLNSADNTFIQPSENNSDQSQQLSDILQGTGWVQDDVLIGRLGADILDGGRGNDVLIGGTEHFNPFNRDKAFGRVGPICFYGRQVMVLISLMAAFT